MRSILLSIFFTVCLSSFAFSLPFDLTFSPRTLQRISIPHNVAGRDDATLKKYEVVLAQRIKESGDNPFLSHKLGAVLFHQGRVDEALNLWERTSKQEKNLPSADLSQDIETLYRFMALRKNIEAQEKLLEIEKEYQDNPHFALLQAEKAMQSGNVQTAGDTYRKAIKLDPSLFVAHLNYARYLDFTGELEKAEDSFLQAMKLAPENKDVLTAYAIFSFKQDQLEKALDLYEKIHALDKNEPVAEVQLALLYVKMKDYYGGLYWYKQALAETDTPKNPLRVALSDVQMRLGLYDEAENNITKVLESDKEVPLLIAMGTIKEVQKDFAGAEAFYRKALEREPDYIVANNNLAMLLVKMEKNIDEALFFAEKAYAKKSDNPMILGTYGCALFYAGKMQAAKEVLAKVIKLSPADAWSRYCYGTIVYKEQKQHLAEFQLESVLLIEPEFVHRLKIEEMLKSI